MFTLNDINGAEAVRKLPAQFKICQKRSLRADFLTLLGAAIDKRPRKRRDDSQQRHQLGVFTQPRALCCLSENNKRRATDINRPSGLVLDSFRTAPNLAKD